jgi:hypothetical protein
VSASDRERWDAKYAEKPAADALSPDDWLIEQVAGLPPGRALELACGLGHNAIWLALRSWRVDAVDISATGLVRAGELARQCCAHVNWITASTSMNSPPNPPRTIWSSSSGSLIATVCRKSSR